MPLCLLIKQSLIMKLSVKASSEYNVIIESNLLTQINQHLDEFNNGQLFILCYPHCLLAQAESMHVILKNENYNVELLEIPDGEPSKQFDNMQFILKNIIDLNAKRDSILLSFGGGSIGDSVGFAASIYMRGIKYINIPTTLLSMVDSSIGGKTGMNYAGIKNIVGTFYHPSKVCIDPLLLSTLPKPQIRSGLGEIIKYGLIHDGALINQISDNYNCIIQLKNKDLIAKIIFECCLIKKYYIDSDENDFGIRNILNFGHTLGHIIESKYENKGITHGEAIINGIFLSVKLSYFKKILSAQAYKNIQSIFNDLDVSYNYKLEPKDIKNINFDKKNTHSHHRFILLQDIGKPIICDNVSKDDILSII